jgi:hypothetical protein
VSIGSLVTKYHAIGSCPLGQSRSRTTTTLTDKLGGEPGAKLFDRASVTAIAETSSVASRSGRAALWSFGRPVAREFTCTSR